MKKLYVYADFDWLKEIEFIGELGISHFVILTAIVSRSMIIGCDLYHLAVVSDECLAIKVAAVIHGTCDVLA